MLKMIDPDHALALVLEHTPSGLPETVPLDQALGLTLVDDVRADRDYPPFARAMMDGYAVRLSDAGASVRVVGEVSAGQLTGGTVQAGTCLTIMTGAPCPQGTEAVVPVEDVRVGDLHVGGSAITLPKTIRRLQHIAPQGSECPAGGIAVCAGARISPLAVATLAAVGQRDVRVLRRPSLSIITTGDELVVAGQAPGPAQIRNSNGPMLLAAARARGLVDVTVAHASDTASGLAHALSEAQADVVLLSGGVSMGRYDLVPEALSKIGATAVFHKVTQKPGKPLLFAVYDRRLYFGLPGNPLSSLFCFERYVAAALCKLCGLPPPKDEAGLLATPLEVRCERTLFVPARTRAAAATDQPLLELVPVDSSDVFATSAASVFVRLEPGVHRLAAGTVLPFCWMGGCR